MPNGTEQVSPVATPAESLFPNGLRVRLDCEVIDAHLL
jgi:hypothetical protein